MSTMPPISSFGSAPVMTLSSPAARTPSIQSRKSRLAISRPPSFVVEAKATLGSVWLKSDRLRKAGVRADLPLELLAERWQKRVRSRASAARSFIRNDPSKDRLDRGEAWVFRLAHDGEQLEPELVVGALHKIANGACDEIRRDHGRCCSASLDSGGESRIQRRKHRARHIRTIEIGN